jgi:hypothetical protein
MFGSRPNTVAYAGPGASLQRGATPHGNRALQLLAQQESRKNKLKQRAERVRVWNESGANLLRIGTAAAAFLLFFPLPPLDVVPLEHRSTFRYTANVICKSLPHKDLTSVLQFVLVA